MARDGGGAGEATVIFYRPNLLTVPVQISLKSSVEDLKLAFDEMTGWPVGRQRLIFNGQLMKNDRTLESYGIKDNDTVRLVTKPVPQNDNSTSRKADTNEHWPSERPDPIGPLSSTEHDPDDWPKMEERYASSTPNTNPLPNPWASTGTGGRQGRHTNTDARIIHMAGTRSARRPQAEGRDTNAVPEFNPMATMSSASRRQAGGRENSGPGFYPTASGLGYSSHEASSAGMNSRRAGGRHGRHTNTDARIIHMVGTGSARRPQAEGRDTNAGPEFNPMAVMSSASRPQAEGRDTNAGPEFNPMAGLSSASRPQAEGRDMNVVPEFNPMATMSSASRPQAGGRENSGPGFYPTASGLGYSSHEASSAGMNSRRAGGRRGRHTNTDARIIHMVGTGSARRPQAEGRDTNAGPEFNPMAGMSSASRPQAEGRDTNAGPEFNPMAGMSSASRPQAEGRDTNVVPEFNPMATMSSASRPQAGGRENSGPGFYPTASGLGYSSREASSAGMNSRRVPFDVQYVAQLLELLEMGFSDFQRNMEVLIVTGGDVRAAVDLLQDSPDEHN